MISPINRAPTHSHSRFPSRPPSRLVTNGEKNLEVNRLWSRVYQIAIYAPPTIRDIRALVGLVKYNLFHYYMRCNHNMVPWYNSHHYMSLFSLVQHFFAKVNSFRHIYIFLSWSALVAVPISSRIKSMLKYANLLESGASNAESGSFSGSWCITLL